MSTSSSSALQRALPYLSPALLLSAFLTSAVTFVVRRPKLGQVALPIHREVRRAAGEGEGVDVEEEEAPAADPFDLYDPLIWEDGVSLDDGLAFWTNVRRVKIPFALLLVGLLALKSTQLVLPLVRGAPLSSAFLLETLVSLVVYTYLVALGWSYIPIATQPKHWASTIHLASVLATVVVVRSLETLLPGQKRAHGLGWFGRWAPLAEWAIATVSD